MRRGIVVVVLAGLAVSGGNAFEQTPEYNGIWHDDPEAIDNPVPITAEYVSDYTTYLQPLDWEYDRVVNRVVYDGTAGSTTGMEFIMRQYLHVRHSFLEELQFSFVFTSDRDREEDFTRHILEMAYRPIAGLGVALYGEPSRWKKEDTVGAALLLGEGAFGRHRLFATVFETERSHRSNGTDRFLRGHEPFSVGVSGVLASAPGSGERNYLKYALRNDAPTMWVFPDESVMYTYEKQHASLAFRRRVGARGAVETRLQYDRKSETHDSWCPLDPTPRESVLRKRLMSLLQCEVGVGNGRLLPGMAYYRRRWELPRGPVLFSDVEPRLAWRFGSYGRRIVQNWEIGYDAVIRRHQGTEFMAAGLEGKPVEHRADVKWQMAFGERASVIGLFTFDLDEFGTLRTWEGGNAMLRVGF